MNKLEVKDSADLKRLEGIIERGQKNFIEVGQALFVIKQRRLYRETAGTFQEYCQERWGWGASRARQICGAVKFWEEHKDQKPPENEWQARAKIGEDKKTTVDNKSDTIKSVTGRNTLLGSTNISGNAHPKPEIVLDKVGRPIPENLLAEWNRAHEMGTRLRSMVSDVKCILEKGIGQDKIFAELVNSVISDAKSLHYSLAHLLPYSVCPTCQGKIPDKCTTCRHRGFISQFYWDGPAVGADLRSLIEKQAKAYARSQTVPA